MRNFSGQFREVRARGPGNENSEAGHILRVHEVPRFDPMPHGSPEHGPDLRRTELGEVLCTAGAAPKESWGGKAGGGEGSGRKGSVHAGAGKLSLTGVRSGP